MNKKCKKIGLGCFCFLITILLIIYYIPRSVKEAGNISMILQQYNITDRPELSFQTDGKLFYWERRFITSKAIWIVGKFSSDMPKFENKYPVSVSMRNKSFGIPLKLRYIVENLLEKHNIKVIYRGENVIELYDTENAGGPLLITSYYFQNVSYGWHLWIDILPNKIFIINLYCR